MSAHGEELYVDECSGASSIISIQRLVKRFGDYTALDGIDLEVRSGQILGYVGPNGAGKTTTVRILLGMLAGFTGRVEVCGYNVATHPLEVKRRVGYVPENAALYDVLTPLEHLTFVGRLYGLSKEEVEHKAETLLELFGLGQEKSQRMTSFSKGMRQKVLIIAGLLHNPDLILMDEPLSGLDANTALIVKEILSELSHQGKTVFYCSHVLDVVERVCDRIVIIDHGKIIADGPFEALQEMSREPSLERIFTRLTSEGGQGAVARRFVAAIGGNG